MSHGIRNQFEMAIPIEIHFENKLNKQSMGPVQFARYDNTSITNIVQIMRDLNVL